MVEYLPTRRKVPDSIPNITKTESKQRKKEVRQTGGAGAGGLAQWLGAYTALLGSESGSSQPPVASGPGSSNTSDLQTPALTCYTTDRHAHVHS